MIVSFVLQAVALHLGRLSQVQPILTTELVFLSSILAVWFRFTIGRREWIGSLAVTAGLAGFLYFAHPQYGTLSPPVWEWIVIGGACSGAMVIAVALATRGPPGGGRPCSGPRRPSASRSPRPAPRRWPASRPRTGPRCTGTGRPTRWPFFGALAVFLAQNAFHAGPIVASQSTLVLVDPLASILIGIGLFGDDLQTSGAWGRWRRCRCW